MSSTTPEPELNVEEQIENLFTLRISSSGAKIDVGLPGHREDVLHVDYVVYLSLRNRIAALIQQVSDQRVREFSAAAKARRSAFEDRITDSDMVEHVECGGFEYQHIVADEYEKIIDQTLADYLSHKEATK